MKTVKYVPKEISQPFIDALSAKFSKLGPQTQKEIETQIKAGQMQLLVAHDGDQLKGGMVVQGKKTPQGPTAFIYGVFGSEIINKDYFPPLKNVLKIAGFDHIAGFSTESKFRLYKKTGVPLEITKTTPNGVFFGAKL